MRRTPRGQAVVEVALAILVLVPIILGGIFLAESAIFRLKATEAATEPMWDATAYRHNAYTRGFDRTPAAVAAANSGAAARARGATLVFTRSDAPQQRCSAGTGHGLRIDETSAFYVDNGGMSCTSRLTVDPHGITRFFLDTGADGFFQEPMVNMLKHFQFCETEKCQPFRTAIGDWGLTNLGGEDEECELTMSGCANLGFFRAGRVVYEAHRSGEGTRNDAFVRFVDGVVQERPANLPRMTDFQMSFKGEESGFTQNVPVSEGEPEWKTTETYGAWGASYGIRSGSFLGLPP